MSKRVAALAIASEIDEGRLELDAAIARYWPNSQQLMSRNRGPADVLTPRDVHSFGMDGILHLWESLTADNVHRLNLPADEDAAGHNRWLGMVEVS